MRFSLIIATYGRKSEIDAFLQSIERQRYDTSKIEIIIVDQNDKIVLDNICAKYSNKLNIEHIKSDKKGLSFNRNIGLRSATGEIIAFPDDDCTYYPETLVEVENYFKNYDDVDVVLGKIYDRKIKKNIIRDWKDYVFKISVNNFFLSFSSITIFAKKNDIFFDNEFGVGTLFGSNEDGDYILQHLNENKIVYYSPAIEVWHPDFSSDVISHEKVYSYGLGFGALVKKHLSLPLVFLFFQSLFFHIFQLIIAIFCVNKHEIKKRYLSVVSRAKGFYLYDSK